MFVVKTFVIEGFLDEVCIVEGCDVDGFVDKSFVIEGSVDEGSVDESCIIEGFACPKTKTDYQTCVEYLVVICRIFDSLNNKFNFTTGKSFPIEQSKCILNQEVGFSYYIRL